jgi:hypothetical protein
VCPKAKPVNVPIAPSGGGGPGNFRGSEFQKSLYLIHRHLYEPLKPSSITIEPRFVHPDKVVTCWDIRTEPPLTASEVKANLSKDDLLEFLRRAGEPFYASPHLRMCGRRGVSLSPCWMQLLKRRKGRSFSATAASGSYFFLFPLNRLVGKHHINP